MKKILTIIIAAMMVSSMAACGSAGKSAPDIKDSSMKEASESIAESSGESEPLYSAVPQDEENSVSEEPVVPVAEGEQIVTGLITYCDGDTLMIVTEDFKNLDFIISGDEVDTTGASGLIAGSKVEVHYAGEISSDDIYGAQVTKLVQSEEQAVAVSNIKAVGGTITESGDSILNIYTPEGVQLRFVIAEDSVDKTNAKGLEVDDFVTVFYTGEIGEDGNTENAVVAKLVQ